MIAMMRKTTFNTVGRKSLSPLNRIHMGFLQHPTAINFNDGITETNVIPLA
jgi:hypothetical protein